MGRDKALYTGQGHINTELTETQIAGSDHESRGEGVRFSCSWGRQWDDQSMAILSLLA